MLQYLKKSTQLQINHIMWHSKLYIWIKTCLNLFFSLRSLIRLCLTLIHVSIEKVQDVVDLRRWFMSCSLWMKHLKECKRFSSSSTVTVPSPLLSRQVRASLSPLWLSCRTCLWTVQDRLTIIHGNMNMDVPFSTFILLLSVRHFCSHFYNWK